MIDPVPASDGLVVTVCDTADDTNESETKHITPLAELANNTQEFSAWIGVNVIPVEQLKDAEELPTDPLTTTNTTSRSFNAGVNAPEVFGVLPVSAVPIAWVQVAIYPSRFSSSGDVLIPKRVSSTILPAFQFSTAPTGVVARAEYERRRTFAFLPSSILSSPVSCSM
jgi:hypothetical protein